MKTNYRYVKFVVAMLMTALLLVTSTIPAMAGMNGQQITLYACEATRVRIQGYNQNGIYYTYNLIRGTPSCSGFNVTGVWWKGTVTVTPYYYVSSEYPSYAGLPLSVYIPTTQVSNWVNVTIQPPSARQKMIWRAQTWVNDRISYNKYAYHDGYRQDCSGYASFVWGLSTSYTTTSILQQSYKISFDSLQAGDALDSTTGGHIIIFAGWVNKSSGIFNAYEENPYYSGAHKTYNITVNKTTGKLTLPGYTYPGTYIAIRKNGL